MKVNKGQSNSAKGDIARLLSILVSWQFWQVMSNQVMSRHCRHLEVNQIGNSAIRRADPENRRPYNKTWCRSDDPLRRYGHSKFDIY